MKLTKTFIIPLALIVACGWLLHSAYEEVKNRAIDQLNHQQLVMAETAARGIESFFEHYSQVLTELSKMDQIASFDEGGKQLMQTLYLTHANEIKGVTRVNAAGRIIYTFPETPGAIGADLSPQEHVQRIMETHQQIVSDVFDSVQGIAAMAFHVPVFKDEVFQGSLAILIPFQELSRKYLEPIRIGKDGYAWMISRKGVELYCPVPGHIGRPVFENCEDFPTILSMAREMVKGNRGTTTYVFDRVRGETVESLKKQAVYVPVQLGNTFWSIVVATPEYEVLDMIQGFRNKWFLIIGVLMLIAIVWTAYILRTFSILREEEKRKRAEEALRENEELYQTLTEASPDAISVTDAHGLLSFTSPKALEMFGYSRDDDVLGRSVLDWVAPEQRETALSNIGLILAGEPLKEAEYTLIKRDGSRFVGEINAAALYSPEGNLKGTLLITRDITERKRTADSFLELHAELQQLIEVAAPLAIIDKDFRISRVNDSFCDLFALNREDIIGRLCHEVWQGPLCGTPECMLKQVLSGSAQSRYVVERELPNGRKLSVLVIAQPLRNASGEVLGILENFVDITERKAAERARLQSEERLNMALSSSDMGVWEWNIQTNDIILSPQCFKIYGMEEDSNLTFQTFRNLLHPEDSGFVTNMIEKALADRTAQSAEYRIIHRGGDIRWIHDIGQAYFDQTGKPLRMVGIVQDITEQKKTKAEQAKWESQLRETQKLEAIGTLAGGIAHDFNNILSPIIGYTEMALLETPELAPIRRDLNHVLTAAYRARDLVKQILNFSRREPEQEMFPIDIGLVVKEVLKLLRASLPATIEIRQHLNKGIVVADVTQIHQVAVNLCTNAAHAMEDAGILNVSLTKVQLNEDDLAAISILHLKPGSYVKLSVADTGQGMDSKTMQHIFEPYFTTKGPGKGTGLGLAVVHGIVTRHGGKITVRSEPGKGSVFDVYLPCVDEQPGVAIDSSEPLPMGSERILLVDDEQIIVDLGSRMLKQLGYEVTTKTTPRDALDTIVSSSQTFDLVITDYAMPGMTGIDLAEEILKVRPDIPVILCTGFNEKVTEESVRKVGIAKLVMKPLDRKHLAELLRSVLEERSAEAVSPDHTLNEGPQ